MTQQLAASSPTSLPALQAVARFRLAFEIPGANISPSRLDPWLATLGITITPLRADDPAATAMPHAQWLWRVALLARYCLQTGRLPVFDEPWIERITPGPIDGQWRADLIFPVIEMIARDCTDLALEGASRACTWASTREVDAASRQRWFDMMLRSIVMPLWQKVPGGKGTVPALRAAHAMSVPIMHIGGGTYQLGWGSAARRLSRSVTEGDSALGAKLSQSKWDTARLLALAGLPAPRHTLASTIDEARATAVSLGWPVVVKPGDRERGEGVTVDIADEAALQSAFDHAMSLTKQGHVIVEQQVPGVCHRVFIAHGRLLYAVKRLPIGVSGDGMRTVAQLVQDAVDADRLLAPWDRSGILPIDALALQTLAAQGLEESSVPSSGVPVALRRIESSAWGGIDEEVTSAIHPDNLAAALGAARLVGLEVAGVDIITQDIARPWHETGAIINEVNYSPLLGGGEISKSHLPTFISRLMGPQSGRIPIELFVGGHSSEWARNRAREWSASGLRVRVVDGDGTTDAQGKPVHQSCTRIRDRVRALLVDASVDAIAIAMTREELRTTGLPVPGVTIKAADAEAGAGTAR